MGQLFSSLWNNLFGSGRELKIVMVGLDNAGKTTVLYRMSLGQTVEAVATVGSNVEQLKHGNLTFEVSTHLQRICMRNPTIPQFIGKIILSETLPLVLAPPCGVHASMQTEF
jgi:GTPase SAR1 family protein